MKYILSTLIVVSVSVIANEAGSSDADRLYLDKQYIEASFLYVQECEKGIASSCTILGFMYDKALGLPKNDHEAAHFYKRGCEGGDQRGCVNYAIMWEKQQADLIQDPAAILNLFTEACDYDYAMGCYFAALSYEQGKIVRKNLMTAEHYYDKACTLGVTEACHQH